MTLCCNKKLQDEPTAMLPDKLDKEKLYIQLTNILQSNIRSGVWRTGQQIPTEEDLCKSYGVSKITVRRAIDNLVFDGYLEKLQGKGTFVRKGPPRSGIAMKTTLVEGVFLPGDIENVKVVEKKVLHQVDDEVARRMGPVVDRDVFYLCRLKSFEGVPVLVNEIYIPLRVCPGLTEWDPEGGAVFEYLQDHSTAKIARVTQTVEVGRAGDYLGGLLNTRPTSACMVMHRLFLSAGGMTVAYSKTTARADRFQLDSEYERLG